MCADALKGLVDLSPEVSVFGEKFFLPAKYLSFRNAKNPRLSYQCASSGNYGHLSLSFRVFEIVDGVLIMNSGMRARVFHPQLHLLLAHLYLSLMVF